MRTKMISCNEYDYIEIVCLYHYPIKLTMKNGEEISGIAQDTKRNGQRQECIQMTIADKPTLVLLEAISKLQVCVENPHFNEVVFK